MRTILQRAAIPDRKADLILVHLSHNKITPYVSWNCSLLDEDDTYHGNYYRDLHEAVTKFEERCLRCGAKVYSGERPA